MKNNFKLTTSQALVKFLTQQKIKYSSETHPLFKGVFAIFGHGNVAGLGEALYQYQNQLPTFRGHNEQAMAHSAIAFAKAHNRRQIMACTSSIGPGATNMVTACALAHVNRLPVLFLPGDTFANRAPDPVLQQVESFSDPNITANDCFKPVSRFFDRITRPEQLITSLPQAMRTLLDPADCGPVTLSLSQDVQAQSYSFPEYLFEERVHVMRRPIPDQNELKAALELIKQSKCPLIIAGGGVQYSLACSELLQFAQQVGIPVAETQAGKGCMPFDHSCSVGGIGVTGTSAANELAKKADLILAIGTRLQDFTTGSHSLFNSSSTLLQINVNAFDAYKQNAKFLIGDAKACLETLTTELKDYCVSIEWASQIEILKSDWLKTRQQALSFSKNTQKPTDAQVLGVLNDFIDENATVVCAAGGLPGELHKHWLPKSTQGYHLEYGYSCMGYEIAGGLGVKMAHPKREVYVLVGDGSYMMLNSEIASSVNMGYKLNIILLDNHGFGCIHRLQRACGIDDFNNLHHQNIDFVSHAKSLGAHAQKVEHISELRNALQNNSNLEKTSIIVIETNPMQDSGVGGHWWDVAVPETSEAPSVQQAFTKYQENKNS